MVSCQRPEATKACSRSSGPTEGAGTSAGKEGDSCSRSCEETFRHPAGVDSPRERGSDIETLSSGSRRELRTWPLSQRGAWAAGWTLASPRVSTCLSACRLDPWSPCSALVPLIRGYLAQLPPRGEGPLQGPDTGHIHPWEMRAGGPGSPRGSAQPGDGTVSRRGGSGGYGVRDGESPSRGARDTAVGAEGAACGGTWTRKPRGVLQGQPLPAGVRGLGGRDRRAALAAFHIEEAEPTGQVLARAEQGVSAERRRKPVLGSPLPCSGSSGTAFLRGPVCGSVSGARSGFPGGFSNRTFVFFEQKKESRHRCGRVEVSVCRGGMSQLQ